MQQTLIKRSFLILIAVCMAAGSVAFGQADRGQIPSHPRDLKYPLSNIPLQRHQRIAMCSATESWVFLLKITTCRW